MVWEDNKFKLLGILTDNELKFDSHILNICYKAYKKLSVLCRLDILTFQQRRIHRSLHSLNITLLYECSVVDLPITKSTSFTKELYE